MNEIITVILPVYNSEKTINEAIDSIISQTYEDWVMIICDDGSTDLSKEIIKKYVKLYPEKITFIQNKHNLGLNETLNKCIKIVQTDYIARMDSDDISYPTRFEEEMKFLKEHLEYDFVCTPFDYFDENGIFASSRGGFEPKKYNFVKASPFYHASTIFRKEPLLKVGGYSVSKRLLRVEDYHLWYKLYSKGYKGYILEDPLYAMRDDLNAFDRRTFRNRINETYVKYLIYKEFNYNKRYFFYFIYILKPIFVWMLPKKIYKCLRNRRK